MRRLNTFLAIGLAGVLVLLGGLSWDALAHANDPHLARHEGVFTLANPAHVALLAGVTLVVVGVVGALDASLRASTTGWSSARRRRTALGAAAVPVAVSMAVAGWAMTRTLPSPVPVAPPFEDIASPDDHHESDDADAPPATAQHQAEAVALVTATKLSLKIAGYEDVAIAEAAGYRAVQPPTSRLVHYVNFAHLVDPGILSPAAPESLVYRSASTGPVLQGAMYVLPSVDSPIPDVGGLADHWHGHDDLCFSTTTAMIVATLGPDGTCPGGSRNEVTPPMLHVWTVDRPGGPFAGL
jgi:hypothetical protein